MPRRPPDAPLLWAALLLGSILSLLVCYDMARLSLVLGSPEGHWVYRYIQPFHVRSIGVAMLASAMVGALVAVPDSVARRYEWILVVVWLFAALALQWLLCSLSPFTFESIFVSDGANSFYSVTRHYTAATALRDFDRLRVDWPLHAQSNMPGKLMLVYALRYISRRPDVIAWLVVALSNLGGVLMYFFTRDLFTDRRTALFSLVMYFFVPAKLYFFPLLNTVTPVLVLFCAVVMLRWLRTSRAVYPALLGAGLYALFLFEPLALSIGLLLVALAARAIWRADITWRTVLAQGCLAVLAFAATYGLVLAWFHFDLFGALGQVGAAAVGFNARQGRAYSIWIWQNALDFLFGVGLCQAVVFFVALSEALSGTEAWQSRLTRPIFVLSVALAGILAVINLIGVNRGEVIRLWIFLACLFQIPTAYACARLNSRAAVMLVMGTTLLQDALGTSMIGFILPG